MVKEYELKKVKIEDIKVDKENPNRMSKEELMALKHSIDKFGYLVPIILDKDLIVADGEHRVQAYAELGYDEIPAFVLDDISVTDRKLIRQVMNKLKGKHNYEDDIEEIKRLMDSGAEAELLALLPSHNKEIKNIIDKINVAEKDSEDFDIEQEIKKIKDPQTKQGDRYKLGEHILMCGDSTIPEQVNILMSDDKADIIFIDPPYNTAIISDKDGKMDNNQQSRQNYEDFISKIMKNQIEHSKKETSFYICIDFRNYHLWVNYIENFTDLKVMNCIVWDKVFAGVGYKYRFRHEFIIFAGHPESILWNGNTIEEDVIKINSSEDIPGHYELDMKGYSIPLNNGKYLRMKIEPEQPARVPLLEIKEGTFRTNNTEGTDMWEGFSMNYFSQREIEFEEGIVHPTMKPTRLINMALMNSSRPGNIVLDLCGGSGSTLISAEKTKRKCRIMEISPLYCDLTLLRWERLTSQKAIKIIK